MTSLSLNAPYGADLVGLLENVACNSAPAPSRLETALLKSRSSHCSLKFELRELHAIFGGAQFFLAQNKVILEAAVGGLS